MESDHWKLGGQRSFLPQLSIGHLIGRRKELRKCLRALRENERPYSGVVFTGAGGIGKSALAGCIMQRLREKGCLVITHKGRFGLRGLVKALRDELMVCESDWAQKTLVQLIHPHIDDLDRLQVIARLLGEQDVVLVFEDFEQNLCSEGDAFLIPAVAEVLKFLAEGANRGRLLIISRYRVPGVSSFLHLPVGLLSPAESRELVLRLDALRQLWLESRERAKIIRMLGGHPRLLELLNVLLGGSPGRLPYILEKLETLLKKEGMKPDITLRDVDQALQQTLALGMRDIMLEELWAMEHQEQIESVYFQLSVSNLPLTSDGVARMPAGGDASEAGDTEAVEQALTRLQHMGLVYRNPADGAIQVDRWISEGLAKYDAVNHKERCLRAGRYRLWRAKHENRLDDVVEAVRNFLAGGDFDSAMVNAIHCLEALERFKHSVDVSALASEVLESMPENHPGYAAIAAGKTQIPLAFGWTKTEFRRYKPLSTYHWHLRQVDPERVDYQRYLFALHIIFGGLYYKHGQSNLAHEAYQKALAIAECLAQAEPERLDYQRDLSLAYNKVAEMYLCRSQSDLARKAYQKAMVISERLVQAKPERADYQQDLSVSYNNMGNLYRDFGQSDLALEAYQKAFAIRKRLAQTEPENTEYQNDLSVSYIKMADLFFDLGRSNLAQEAYQEALAIRESLAKAEPEMTDYQQNLLVSLNCIGTFYYRLGQSDLALEAYQKALEIAERHAQAAPESVDYQHDLSVSYERMGELYCDLGLFDLARDVYQKSLRITERLAQADPDNDYYQYNLSLSFSSMGDLYRDISRNDLALEEYQKALAILERLAQAEPESADYQNNLSVLYKKFGELYIEFGMVDFACDTIQKALAISEQLAQAEPERADYQRDLMMSYERMGTLYLDLDQEELARKAYQKALAITERLAQAEPERADYQRDLVVALVHVGMCDELVAYDYTRRALSILESLKATGRLSPVDEPMIIELRRLFTEQ